MVGTMLPSASGGVTGFNPNSGSNTFVDEAMKAAVQPDTNKDYFPGRGEDALSALYNLAKENPEYMETYLQLLAERENTTNAQQWYEKLSDSSYQRAVKDLEKAGLNPALALSGLNGASSGSVQPASTWSTSPYANKVSRDQARAQNLSATANMLKAVLGLGTITIAAMAALL